MAGYDVARAFAILGMVFVNYRGRMESGDLGPAWLVWFADRIEGRSAALFVMLAGVGIALRLGAKDVPREERLIDWEQRALMKRAVALFLIGLLNLHMWDWDILHFYGVYLLIAVVFMRAHNRVLALGGIGFMIGGALLQSHFDYDYDADIFTAVGFVRDVFFNGLHPVFPWMVFVLLGIWLGRRDLSDPSIRKRVAIGGSVAFVVAETSAYVLDIGTWPRPPTPFYVLSASGTALLVVVLCLELTRLHEENRWVLALVATGQLSFSIYIAHVVAIVVPMQHDLFIRAPLWAAMVYGSGMYVLFVAMAVWWRRRFRQGPIEGLFRQITGRTTPAPWGGEPLPR